MITELHSEVFIGGYVPLDEPVCGYTGVKCDNRPYIYGAVGLVAGILAIVASVLYWIY